jgi:nitrate reductase cytochrome c-type subunit
MGSGCLTERLYRALEPRTIPSTDAPTGLASSSATVCGVCHSEIYAEWKNSMMGQAFTDVVFQAEWTHKGEFSWCLNCHAPLQNQQPLIVDGLSSINPPTAKGEPNPDFDPALRSEGVTCVVCHQQESAIRAPHADSQAPHAVVHDETLSSPEMCIDCHQMDILPFTRVERPLTDSHREWEEWKELSGRTEDCLDCHMPAITRPVVNGGIEREGRKHTFVGAWDDETVRSALEVGEPRRVGNVVEIELENLSGHRFPSGEPARILWVRLHLRSASDETIDVVEARLDRRVEGPGAREKYDTTLAPTERRTIRLEVDPAHSAEAQSAYLEVAFDRYGNLDALIEELAHSDLQREILLAERTLPW